MADSKSPLEVHGSAFPSSVRPHRPHASFGAGLGKLGGGRSDNMEVEAFPLPPPAEFAPDDLLPFSSALTPTHSPGRPNTAGSYDQKAFFWPPPAENPPDDLLPFHSQYAAVASPGSTLRPTTAASAKEPRDPREGIPAPHSSFGLISPSSGSYETKALPFARPAELPPDDMFFPPSLTPSQNSPSFSGRGRQVHDSKDDTDTTRPSAVVEKAKMEDLSKKLGSSFANVETDHLIKLLKECKEKPDEKLTRHLSKAEAIMRDTIEWLLSLPHPMRAQMERADNFRFSMIHPAPLVNPRLRTRNTFLASVQLGSVETTELLLERGYRPALLNFAHGYNCGGGFDHKEGSQEEDIFRKTSVFLSLWPHRRRDDGPGALKRGHWIGDYDERLPRKEAFYEHTECGGIYSPHVCVVRNTNERNSPLLDVLASAGLPRPLPSFGVISVAAQNVPYDPPFRSDLLKEKARTILWLAASQGHDSVVLGAFGCGYFQNPPDVVAETFSSLLCRGGEFENVFSVVAFGIGSGIVEDNAKPFVERFPIKALPQRLHADGANENYDQSASSGVSLRRHQDELAQTGILALRKWLDVKCGLSTVAERIRSFDPTSLHPLVSCAAITQFLSSWQCAAVNDGTLDRIFEWLDPQRLGVIDLDDLLGPVQQDTDKKRQSSGLEGSLAPAPASEFDKVKVTSLQPGAQKKIMELTQKENEARVMQAEALGAEHWGLLRSLFYGLASDGCDEVVVQILLAKIRDDYRVRSSGLLDKVLEMQPGDKRTTLSQGLEHVEAHLLQTISWERFRCLLLEAPRNRRPTIGELMHAEALRRSFGRGLTPSGARAAGRDESDFSPNSNPEMANQWMETTLGVDGAMLRKIYGLFSHCQKGASVSAPVRKGDFVRLLQKNPAMMASFTSTPLCIDSDADRVARPQVWGEVLVHLNCHESDVLTWADVLEVIRWHCDLCFDRVPAMAVGPGGYRYSGLPGAAFANGRAKDRLTKLMVGSENVDGLQQQQQQESPRRLPVASDMERFGFPTGVETMNREPTSPVAAVSGLFDKSTRPMQPASPVSAVDGLFNKALHPVFAHSEASTSKPRRKGAHPFVDYDSDVDIEDPIEDDDCDPAAVARLLADAQRRKRGEGMNPASWQQSPSIASMMPKPSSVGSEPWAERRAKQTKLRIRVGAHHLGVSSVEQLEEAIAEILQIDQSSVRYHAR